MVKPGFNTASIVTMMQGGVTEQGFKFQWIPFG